MKRSILLAMTSFLATAHLPAMSHAQSATGVGVGTGTSVSRSTSAATAIGGGNATGGSSTATGGTASLTLNTAAQPSVTTVNSVASGTQTLRNVPTVFAPGLSAAGLETCLGSVSGGVGVIGTGASFGSTIPDPGCAARLDARTLWAFGLRKAAVARLCLMVDIQRAMPEVCAEYVPPPPPQEFTFLGFRVAPIVSAAAVQQPPTYEGGPVEVVVHGHRGVCDDYDVARHRCRGRIHYN